MCVRVSFFVCQWFGSAVGFASGVGPGFTVVATVLDGDAGFISINSSAAARVSSRARAPTRTGRHQPCRTALAAVAVPAVAASALAASALAASAFAVPPQVAPTAEWAGIRRGILC